MRALVSLLALIVFIQFSFPQGHLSHATSDILYAPTSVLSDSNMTTTYLWPYGASYAVTTDSNYLFVGFGAGIVIYQVGTGGQLTKLSEIATNSRALKMVKSGAYLFVANQRAGLPIYDVSNIRSPLRVSSIPATYDVQDLRVRGNYVYFADSWFRWSGTSPRFEGRFKIYDVTNITDPVERANLDMGGECTAIYLQSTYALTLTIRLGILGGTESRFRTYDISNPSNPLFQGELNLGPPRSYTDDMGDITVVGTNAFVTHGPNGIKRVDVSNIQAPALRQTISLNSQYAFRIDQYDTTLLITTRYNGLVKIGVANPNIPSAPYYRSLTGEQFGACYNNGYIFVASGWENLRVLNAANPMTQVNQEKKGHQTGDVLVDGDKLYTADGLRGMKVFQIQAAQSRATLLGGWENGYAVGALAKYSNFLYVTEGTQPTQILNVSNPPSPVFVATVSGTPDKVNDVYVKDTILYHVQEFAGVSTYGLSNPSNPALLGSYNTAGRSQRCVVQGNYCYVASESAGVRILNVANPRSITEVGFYDPAGIVYDIDVSANRAFVAASTQGLLVLDITDPAIPLLRRTYAMPDGKPAKAVKYRDPLLYVVSSLGALYAYYVYPPDSLVRFAHHIADGLHSEIFRDGDYGRPAVDQNNWIYLGCGTLGWLQDSTRYTITAVDESTSLVPTGFELFQNYPNPFNPLTTIKYELPRESFVTLRVFDILGREIATLVNDKQDAGYKSVEWNAASIASGVYLYRLQTANFVQTRKMILIR